jgi:eukaryotic-like serine/threonine-protein kinase
MTAYLHKQRFDVNTMVRVASPTANGMSNGSYAKSRKSAPVDFSSPYTRLHFTHSVVRSNDMTLAPGTRLGRYEIRAHIGTGGMGEIYQAADIALERTIALKILPAEFASDPSRMRRFVQEARAASALNHPNILTIYEINPDALTPYIATEFIDGITLRRRLRDGRINLMEGVEIAIQIASALDAAHQAGIVHRDVKPENVMLRKDGYVKVLDFGLARPTERHDVSTEAATIVNTEIGIIVGTASYMSPEQARGQRVDARSDIFSLGMVIYEMVAGRSPFLGSTNSDIVASILKEEPPRLAALASGVPAELETIVNRALTKDKDERYQSVGELLRDLKRLKQNLDFEFQSELPEHTHTHSRDSGAVPTAMMPARSLTIEEPQAQATSASTMTIAPRSRWARAAILIAIPAIALGAYLFFTRKANAVDSIAVLPFTYTNSDRNETLGPDANWLSDGITESIINDLSHVPNLKVIARSSVFRYKGQNVDPQTIGRDLNVRAVVIGRIVQMGDTVTVQTELVDVQNQTQLWGERYRRKITDVLELPEDISRQISEGLKLELSGEARKQIGKRYTVNPQAYELYWKGRYHWNQRKPEDVNQAIKYFQEAIKLDPNYALAYTGLADCYVLGNILQMPPKEAMPRAADAARKALSIDNQLAEAHTSLAKIKTSYEWDWAGAEAEFKQAIQLNPGYATAHQWYGVYLSEMGRHDESIRERTTAQNLDPLSLSIATGLGRALFWARRYDESIKHLQTTIPRDQNYSDTYWSLGLAYEQKRMYPEAISAFQRAVELSKSSEVVEGKPEMLAVLGHAYAMAGRPAEAKTILDQLKKASSSQQYVSPYAVSLIYVALNDKDSAFQSLSQAFQERDENLIHLRVDPRLDPIRSDPRFQQLLKQINLAS